MIQNVVWFATLFFIALIAGVFIWVAVQSKTKSDYAPVIKKWYKARSIYGVLLVLLMIVVSIYTLRDLPFNKPAYSEGEELTVVDVTALQFGWEISEHEFEVGQTVQFDVETADVTHGFGLYDPDMDMIAQTQAMPEYTNTIYVTFEKAGTYEVLCLEYCGIAHHLMRDELVVK